MDEIILSLTLNELEAILTALYIADEYGDEYESLIQKLTAARSKHFLHG